MNDISIISIDDCDCWNNIVQSFKDYDVYFLNGYSKGFEIHGDGEPMLMYYQSETLRGIAVYLKRDIAKLPFFQDVIPSNTYFDLISPYGYGGFIFEGDISTDTLSIFKDIYHELMKRENIVCEFVRFHPLLKNADWSRSISTVIDLGQTVSMDLSSEETIWDNIASNNRNKIRKAEKNEVAIAYGKDWSLFNDFIEMYNKTMSRDNAQSYYFFGNDFYKSIHDDLENNYEIFYAHHQGEKIAMAIILYANGNMHYHFSGSLFEYRNLAPSNLLLYKAACWGFEKGFKSFHLGGGLGSGEDNLFKFKQGFNRNSKNQFSIGKSIHDDNTYRMLVEKRFKSDATFDLGSSFFPLYRS